MDEYEAEYRVLGEDRWAPFRRWCLSCVRRMTLWIVERIPWVITAAIMYAIARWARANLL
jgi:hypothetical protein